MAEVSRNTVSFQFSKGEHDVHCVCTECCHTRGEHSLFCKEGCTVVVKQKEIV